MDEEVWQEFFGYKNHVNADAKHKLIRRYEVTDAAVHDSQKLDALLTKGNTSADVFDDSAYRSSEIEERLRSGGASRPPARTNAHHAAAAQGAATSCRRGLIRLAKAKPDARVLAGPTMSSPLALSPTAGACGFLLLSQSRECQDRR
jgi:IS5 family transposase